MEGYFKNLYKTMTSPYAFLPSVWLAFVKSSRAAVDAEDLFIERGEHVRIRTARTHLSFLPPLIPEARK